MEASPERAARINHITGRTIRCFYGVYDHLGYGFLEKTYCNSLAYEFADAGLTFAREEPIDVFFKGRKVGHYRADFIIEGCVVIEAKASRSLTNEDWRQLLNCLRATKLDAGLLLHFGPRANFKRLAYANHLKLVPAAESD